MVQTYQINDKELRELQVRVDDLNDQIKIYLDQIQEKSDYYRQCTS